MKEASVNEGHNLLATTVLWIPGLYRPWIELLCLALPSSADPLWETLVLHAFNLSAVIKVQPSYGPHCLLSAPKSEISARKRLTVCTWLARF